MQQSPNSGADGGGSPDGSFSPSNGPLDGARKAMLVKCETKSNRVKGVAFHPKLSWILASLHNGAVQLWDYRIGSVIDKFEEHEGPVRGVDFHLSQPLFVSGGDDYHIKVWNYKQRRCIFTLLGHLDYIRTVQFHPKYPWILSASDDQTVRIWNWQSRSCIAVLTGHNHYVMCAQFHPKDDLVVSASLDQTVRVWDVSGLREKTVSIGGGGGGGMPGGPAHMHLNQATDVFGSNDAVVKYVLEGHDRGVNWAAFHPTLPLVVSGADDRLVKLWRMSEVKAWEVDSLRGHFNNVSCVAFHPKQDLIISNSEDRTIRVWDASKRTALHTFRRETDRFWILATHKTSNLIAVGHDSGMVVFKLDRERPPAAALGQNLLMIKDRFLTCQDLDNSHQTSLGPVRRAISPMVSGIKSLQVNLLNPTELNCLVFYNEPTTGGGQGMGYDLFTCPANELHQAKNIAARSGQALSVAFVARNRFAALDKNGNIGIFNLNNDLSKRVDAPVPVDHIFEAGNNRLLLRAEEKILLFDVTTRKVMNELSCPSQVRYVVWSSQMAHVALLSKHHVMLCDSKLDNCITIHENIRVKSGAWDSDRGVFIYATLSHVKYAIAGLGDRGILHSLPAPIYIVRASKKTFTYISRENTVETEPLETTEYLFKLALSKKQFSQVAVLIRNGRLCGNAIIGYLKRKGYPEVALQFVKDPRTRFNLALEFGHIDEAMRAAQTVDDKACWTRLGTEALRQGNRQIVEMVYQRTKNFERLTFLYMITGSLTKLDKMLRIATKRQDQMSRFHTALLTGDVRDRITFLAEMGHAPLAALTAHTYKVADLTEALSESSAGINLDEVAPKEGATYLIPPLPLFRGGDGEEGNWPLLVAPEALFNKSLAALNLKGSGEGAAFVGEEPSSTLQRPATTDPQKSLEAFGEAEGGDEDETSTGGGVAGWGEEEFGDFGGGANGPNGGGWGDDDLEIEIPGGETTVNAAAAGGNIAEGAKNVTSRGETCAARWTKDSPMVPDLIAAGAFDQALVTLRKRIGLHNAEPLKPYFKTMYQSTWASVPCLPLLPPLHFPLLESGSVLEQTDVPIRVYTVKSIAETLKEAYRLTTQGQFQPALNVFRRVLLLIVLVTASSEEEEAQLAQMISVCREYCRAMRIEIARKELGTSDARRSVELACYLTCCKMQPSHLLLATRMAMTTAYRAQNFITAAAFAKHIIQGHITGAKNLKEAAEQASKCLSVCEQRGTDAHSAQFDISEQDSVTICSESLTIILPHEGSARCPYCSTIVRSEYSGKLCPSCEICQIGLKTLGIQHRALVAGRR